jgi:hypothetical protein
LLTSVLAWSGEAVQDANPSNFDGFYGHVQYNDGMMPGDKYEHLSDIPDFLANKVWMKHERDWIGEKINQYNIVAKNDRETYQKPESIRERIEPTLQIKQLTLGSCQKSGLAKDPYRASEEFGADFYLLKGSGAGSIGGGIAHEICLQE